MPEAYKYLIIVVLLALLLSSLSKNKERTPGEYPYKKRQLLTNAEINFFNSLQQAVPSQYLLFSKVRLWDIIDTTVTKQQSKYTNPIRSKHVDFLLCDKQMQPILVIELDDKSHKQPKQIQRDTFVAGALNAAEIKLFRQPCKAKYDIKELSRSIQDCL